MAEVVQDLFGAWLVKRSWGSLSTLRGNNSTLVASDYEHACQLFQAVAKRRHTRGYQPDAESVPIFAPHPTLSSTNQDNCSAAT